MCNLKLGTIQNLLHGNELIFKLWKKSISVDDAFDQREVEVGTQRKGLLVDLRAAANETSLIMTMPMSQTEAQRECDKSQRVC